MKSLNTFLPVLGLGLMILITAENSVAQKRKQHDQLTPWFLIAVHGDKSQIAKNVDRSITVIRTRCQRLGVQCGIERDTARENHIKLRVSTRMNFARVKEILLVEGLEVRPVLSPPFPFPLQEHLTRDEAMAEGTQETDVLPFVDHESRNRRQTYLAVERFRILTGDDLRGCMALRSSEGVGKYEIDCRVKPVGAARLKAWTGANISRYLAVIFNRKALTAAYVKAQIWYNFQLWGGFDRQRAQDLIVIFESGNLPAQVEIIEEHAKP